MRGKNWEVVFALTKVNGSTEKAQAEYQFDTSELDLRLYLKRRVRELVDQYDFKEVVGTAIQIDTLDKSTGKVYYSSPIDIITFRHENAQ